MTGQPKSAISAMAAFEKSPPAFPAAELQTIALERFGLTGEIAPLVSERDQNARVNTPEGDYVLKIANLGEDRMALEFQQAVLAHLENVAPDLGVPRIRPAKSGEGIVTWPSPDGRDAHLLRAVTFLPGRLFSAVPRTPRCWRVRAVTGRLSRRCRASAMGRTPGPISWNLDNAEGCRGNIGDIAKAEDRALVERVFARYGAQVKPRLLRLRAAVIHHDANDNNIIVDAADASKVTG
jgi:Ser/Thr protein kinase RdoA (MazF antagonist)